MNDRLHSSDAWYTEDGPDNDVIVSSRVRLARNLSGFVFPVAIKSDDAESVLSLVFDSFNHLENPDQYQLVRMSDIDLQGRKILAERGVIEPGAGNDPWRGVVLRNDGALSATINMDDHLSLTSFRPGLNLFSCAKTTFAVDDQMQKHIQFSALSGFGYLASNLFNAGSGMSISVLACLPALCMNGLLDRVVREYLAQGFAIHGFYGSEESGSLGCLYQLSNGSAAAGDPEAQIRAMEQTAGKLVELERKSRKELFNAMPTTVEDAVFRAIVAAKYARFISHREALDLVRRIKLGLNLGLVTGIENRDLSALLFRIQNAHISFVISGGSVIIEKDVETDELKMDRLRAMVIQEVLKNADIHERR
jgi:protein arginine kinase